MSHEPSPITTDIDYERDGVQTSFLRVPNSTNTSAYGTVRLPITVVKKGADPTILFTGGVHGDEYEGPIALMKLSRRLRLETIRGRAIILPTLNLPAVRVGKRLSPIDGKNLNRVFPGNPLGTITETIAHYVDSVLLPLCDIVVDLHSGGCSLQYVPTILTHHLDDAEHMAETLAAAKTFGAPMTLISRDLESVGLLETTAEHQGKITLSAELGGGGVVSSESVSIAETGIWNLLRHFRLTKGAIETPESRGRPETMLLEIETLDAYVMAPEEGIYEPFVDLGGKVDPGQPLGQVHIVGQPDRDPHVVTSPGSGALICKRPPACVEAGDCVGIIARRIEWP